MSLPSSMADLYHVIVSCKRPIEGLDLRTTLNFGGGGGGMDTHTARPAGAFYI